MILITGGIKSGKSSAALSLARARPGPRAFIATAVPFDAEMRTRIERHRAERGDDFLLFQEPTEIFTPLRQTEAGVYLIDCVTTWIANLLHYGKDVNEYLDTLEGALTGREIIVTNETGMGIIPDNRLSREYLTHLGNANKRLAARADEVYLMVAGIKVRIK